MAVAAGGSLGETIVKVRDRISKIRELGEHLGEQDTKAILIEPLLAALGWHADEFTEVRHEYRFRTQDNPVDYALLDFGHPCLLIEAKSLGTPLDHHKCATQVLGYASAAGVGWALLTNGDDYRLYNASAPVPAEEKLFRDVHLSQEDQPDRCLEMFSLIAKTQMSKPDLDALWQSQFVDRRVQATLEVLFDAEVASLAKLVHRHAPELSLAEVRESLQRAQVQVHFPEIAPLVSADGHTPLAPEVKPPKASHSHAVELHDLIEAGLVHPPLTLEKKYKGIQLKVVIEADGCVRFGDEVYDSLSAAGGMARNSAIGAAPGEPTPATNGWKFWQYRDATTGELRSIDESAPAVPPKQGLTCRAVRQRSRRWEPLSPASRRQVWPRAVALWSKQKWQTSSSPCDSSKPPRRPTTCQKRCKVDARRPQVRGGPDGHWFLGAGSVP